jgi:hypothetical protein
MRIVSDVLKVHTSKDYALVFMEDITIYSESEEDRICHLQSVMDILRKFNFELKDRKYLFGRKEMEFVGNRVGPPGIRLLEQKIESISNWPILLSPTILTYFWDSWAPTESLFQIWELLLGH